MKKLYYIKEQLSSLLFYLAILLFIIGFNFSNSPPPFGWYQQFMPNLSGRHINDIAFTDSLNGYAITNRLSVTDSSFILKTTNGGDNWFLAHSDSGVIYSRIQFINQNTGFVGGYIYKNSSFWIVKTTDKGFNWLYITAPFDVAANDMFVLNQDTIWIADNNQLVGGVYRTTNGGGGWQQQLYIAGNNPSHIYMYNSRIGFCCNSIFLYKTMNGGENWTQLDGQDAPFSDMYFNDSLTGWKANGFIKKTTDGGLSWIQQVLPSGGNIIGSAITDIAYGGKNGDTLWGLSGEIIVGSGTRGILFRTTNSGQNWLFQLPDTSIHIYFYFHGLFTDNKHGWAYINNTGIHTTTGGNDTFYTSIKQISTIVPSKYILFQNYPNPFNPSTIIKFQIERLSDVRLNVYDVTGRLITILTDKEYKTGTYEVTFNDSDISSGIYFYSLIIDGKLIDTKKMVLLK